MEVSLNDSEILLAERIAKERYESSREAGIEDQKVGPQSIWDTDFHGILGEIATAKALNVYPDIGIDPSAGGIDLTLPTGRTVDVKTTDYPDGNLIAPTWKQYKANADIFLLVTVSWSDKTPELDLKGWKKSEDLFQSDNVVNWGHGPTFAIEQPDLEPIDELT